MRGLLMVEPLYHQTIKGAKTQTRRSGGLEAVNENPDDWYISGEIRPSRVPESIPFTIDSLFSPAIFSSLIFNKIGSGLISHATGGVECKPRYKVGEVLYIKEPIIVQGKRPVKDVDTGKLIYRYDYPDVSTNYDDDGSGNTYKWSNKLFMPAETARAFIRITGIKCERLMDISDADCISEGIEITPITGDELDILTYTDKKYLYKNYTGNGWHIKAKTSFLSLYKFANKVKEVPNLWVWAYTFEYLPNFKLNEQ